MVRDARAVRQSLADFLFLRRFDELSAKLTAEARAKDLLVLGSFQSIAMLPPAEFWRFERFGGAPRT